MIAPLAAGVTLVLALAAGVLLGRTVLAPPAGSSIGSATSAVTDDSAAAGFARDMTDHHAQAVDMATIISYRTQSAEIRSLATDIALTQTNQMGQMQGWLSEWHLTLGRIGPPMVWMTQPQSQRQPQSQAGQSSPAAMPAMDTASMQVLPDGRMPGMATAAQVNRLRTLPPAKADVLFLQLMIAHHRAGVVMAQMALTLTNRPSVDRLASSAVTGQRGEITQMTELLAARGARP